MHEIRACALQPGEEEREREKDREREREREATAARLSSFQREAAPQSSPRLRVGEPYKVLVA